MAKILAYDFETSGMVDWKSPSESSHQPHIVQVAAILCDMDTGEEEVYQAIVKPDGWEISPEVSAIHGITHQKALDEGVPESEVLDKFHELWRKCDVRIAHNESFDARIMRICYKRFRGSTHADSWSAGVAKCTCKMATPIVNLPPTEKMLAANFNRPKAPSLSECVKHFFNEDLEGAHDAMVDVMACLRIYKELLRLERAHGWR